MQGAQGVLEVVTLTGEHGLVLLLALMAPDAQVRFIVPCRETPGAGIVAGPGFEGGIGFAPGRRRDAAANGDPVIAACPQPGEVGLGGDAGVHDDRGPGGVAAARLAFQPPDGVGESGRLGDVAGQDLAVLRKAGLVQRQGQGHDRTIVTPLLRAPEAGQRGAGPSGHMGVGQVEEDDGLGDAEEIALPGAQRLFKRRAVTPQEVADAVELAERERLAAVDIEQLQGRAVRAQPAEGLALAGGMDHARDHQCRRDACVALTCAQPLQRLDEAKVVERGESQALAAHRADLFVGEAIETDRGHVALVPGPRRAEIAGVKPPNDVLGDGAQGGIRLQQRLTAAEQGLDQKRQFAPLLLGHTEVGAEIEERDLAHPSADAFAAHEAVGGIALATVSATGEGFAHEHGGRVTDSLRTVKERRPTDQRLWHYNGLPKTQSNKISALDPKGCPKSGLRDRKVAKMGQG